MSDICGTVRWASRIGAVVATLLSGAAAATPYIGAAGDFVVLGTEGGTVIINSATSITGNVGYSAGVTGSKNQKVDSFVGAAYIHATATVNYTAATYQPSGGIITGPAADALLDQANADALSASAYLAGLATTHASLGNVVDDQNVVVDSVGALNVISIASLTHKSDTFTIRGGANDVFVFNVSGGWNYDQSQIVLEGVSVGNVIFNFFNASTIDIGKDSTVFQGTMLAPTSTLDYHNPATFTGRIIARHITLHSDFNIAAPADVQVPAPAGAALLGFALLACGAFRRRSGGKQGRTA